ncbi:MAG: hydroxyethylthiazole kinase [Clostridia bacterium]|nr:hydroxyethylthiazole kinase [Clostridia bacterium]
MFENCFDRLRQRSALVHNITNYVTVNDVANIILACGASPIMADEPEEAAEITAICTGLNINIGTLNQRTISSMFAAGKQAKALNHPVLLDPVGAGASTLRTDTARRIVDEIHPDVIRGNISEIKALAQGSGTTQGVDADVADAVTEENLDDSIAFVKSFASSCGCIVAVTGAIDLVSDGDRCYVIQNGRPEMGRITGTGCQLSGMMTAFIAANPDNMLDAAAAAVSAMGLAGEIGWSHMQASDGNSTYRNRIIDAICNMTGTELKKGARYELR